MNNNLTSYFLIGFVYGDNNQEYIEKTFKHTYTKNVSYEQLEKYLIKKYENIISKEYDIDKDFLCISRFIKL